MSQATQHPALYRLRWRLLRMCIADLIASAWTIHVVIPVARLLYRAKLIRAGQYARLCIRGREKAEKRIARGRANLLIIRAANDVLGATRGRLR